MECILLGTGGMMPMPHRLLTSLAVRLNGQIYLFDAGEGCQLNWKRARLGVRGLRLVAVTHLHADHCLGLPGLMMLRAQMDDHYPLTILGPPGTEKFVREIQSALEFYINYQVQFVECSGDDRSAVYEDELVRIYCQPLKHTRFCLGYRLEELDRAGKFDPERAEAFGVSRGPLWGELQNGKTVINATGEAVTPDQVMGPRRRGRHLAFVVDTRPTASIYTLCKKVDIAFIEGMFLSGDAGHADRKGHLTVVESARIAHRAGAQKAVLVHISPRYDNDELMNLEAQAKQENAVATVGRDLDIYSVVLRR